MNQREGQIDRECEQEKERYRVWTRERERQRVCTRERETERVYRKKRGRLQTKEGEREKESANIKEREITYLCSESKNVFLQHNLLDIVRVYHVILVYRLDGIDLLVKHSQRYFFHQ